MQWTNVVTAAKLPRLNPYSVRLQNELCGHQTEFSWQQQDSRIDLSLKLAGELPDRHCQIGGLLGHTPVKVITALSQLQQWMQPQLGDAPLQSLPAELQIALVSQSLSGWLPLIHACLGHNCSIETVEISTRSNVSLPLLAVRIQQQGENLDRELVLWLNEALPDLLAALPKRSMSLSNSALLFTPYLRFGRARLSVAEVESLACGDIIFLEHHYHSATGLMGSPSETSALLVVQQHVLWQVNIIDSQATIMDNAEASPEAAADENVEASDTLEDFSELPVELTFEVGQTSKTLAELNALQPGYVFELDPDAARRVHIRANNHTIGECELVSVNDRLGVRVLSLFQKPEQK